MSWLAGPASKGVGYWSHRAENRAGTQTKLKSYCSLQMPSLKDRLKKSRVDCLTHGWANRPALFNIPSRSEGSSLQDTPSARCIKKSKKGRTRESSKCVASAFVTIHKSKYSPRSMNSSRKWINKGSAMTKSTDIGSSLWTVVDSSIHFNSRYCLAPPWPGNECYSLVVLSFDHGRQNCG